MPSASELVFKNLNRITFPKSAQACFPAGVNIVEYREEEDQGLNHVLVMGAQIHQGHAVVYGGHDKAAYNDPHNGSDATRGGDAAYVTCRDCVKFKEVSGLRKGAVHVSG